MTGSTNGTAPEFYINSREAATDLGVTAAQLKAMTEGCGLRVCARQRCRYTKDHLRRLREVQTLQREYDCKPRVAAKIQAKLEAKRQAKEAAVVAVTR